MAEAAVVAEAALELSRKTFKAGDIRLARSLNNLGSTYEYLGRYQEAIRLHKKALKIRLDNGHLVDVVLSLNNLGAAWEGQGNLQEAGEWYQTAWRFLTEHQIMDPIRLTVGNNLAGIYWRLGDLETARTLFEWVLQAWDHEKGPDSTESAFAAKMLADLYKDLGHIPEARGLYERALATLSVAMPDHPNVGWVHSAMGMLLLQSGAIETAGTHFTRSLTILEAALGPAHPDMAHLLINIAQWQDVSGDIAAALASGDRARVILEASTGPKTITYGTVLEMLGTFQQARGNLSVASKLLKQAATLKESILGADHGDVLLARERLADLAIAEGCYSCAMEQLDELLPRLEKLRGPEHPEVASMRLLRARTLSIQGQAAAARTEYEGAIELLEKHWGPEAKEVADAINGFGAALMEQGNFGEAVGHLKRSLAMYEQGQATGSPEQAAVLNNLGLAHYYEGNFVDARRLLEQALRLEEAIYGLEHPDLATTFHNLGLVTESAADFAAARQWYERSLESKISAHGESHPSLAVTLLALADLDINESRLKEGRSRVEWALRLQRTALGETHPDLALSEVALARLAARERDHKLARTHYLAAWQLQKDAYGAESYLALGMRAKHARAELVLGDIDESHRLYSEVYEGYQDLYGSADWRSTDAAGMLASVQAFRGNTDEARKLVLESSKSFETIVKPLLWGLSERERFGFLRAIPEELGRLLWLFDQPGDASFAYSQVLQWKGLADRILVSQEEAGSNPEVTVRRRSLEHTRKQLGAVTFSSTKDTNATLSELTQTRERLERELAELVGNQSDDGAAPTRPRDICDALPPGTTLIDMTRYIHMQVEDSLLYLVPHYAAFILRGGDCETDPVRVNLGEAGPIEEAITRHLSLLAARATTRRAQTAAKRLRTLVWDPFKPFLGADQVVLAPDASLALVPWAALVLDDGRFLLEEQALAQINTAQHLLRSPSEVEGRGALIVGGVAYGEPSQQASRHAMRAAGCVTELLPLPATEVEAQTITSTLENATLLRGTEATETALRELAPGKRLLHLATHGFFVGEGCQSALKSRPGQEDARQLGMNPMLLSGIALAGANKKDDGSGDDGLWTAAEIASLPLEGTELVVLSACDTGKGVAVEAGEGVMGLRRAFDLAGAESSVLSLWPVEDEATRTVMEALYKHLQEGQGRLEALRSAQLAVLQLRRADGDARPSDWAAFILSGDWR